MLLAGIEAGGDLPSALTSLQNITIVMSLPFVIVMVLMCVSLVRDLANDAMTRRNELGQMMIEQAVISGVSAHDTDEITLVAVPRDTYDPTSGSTALSRLDEEEGVKS